jgi:hypothetical protein
MSQLMPSGTLASCIPLAVLTTLPSCTAEIESSLSIKNGLCFVASDTDIFGRMMLGTHHLRKRAALSFAPQLQAYAAVEPFPCTWMPIQHATVNNFVVLVLNTVLVYVWRVGVECEDRMACMIATTTISMASSISLLLHSCMTHIT